MYKYERPQFPQRTFIDWQKRMITDTQNIFVFFLAIGILQGCHRFDRIDEQPWTKISIGMSETDVVTHLGHPLDIITNPMRQDWYYSRRDLPVPFSVNLIGDYCVISLTSNTVTETEIGYENKRSNRIEKNWAKISIGMSETDVVVYLGHPCTIFTDFTGQSWYYHPKNDIPYPSRDGIPTTDLVVSSCSIVFVSNKVTKTYVSYTGKNERRGSLEHFK